MVALPGFTDVTVTVELLMLAVATPSAFDDTLSVPWAPLTVNVSVFGYAIVPLVLLIVIGFAAFLVYKVYVLLDPV